LILFRPLLVHRKLVPPFGRALNFGGTSPAPRIATPGERKRSDLDPTKKVHLKSGFSERQRRDTNSSLPSSGDPILRKNEPRTSAGTFEFHSQTSPSASVDILRRSQSPAQTFHPQRCVKTHLAPTESLGESWAVRVLARNSLIPHRLFTARHPRLYLPIGLLLILPICTGDVLAQSKPPIHIHHDIPSQL
jgi:hypothetical protein